MANVSKDDAIAAMELPKQFYTHMIHLVEGLAEDFPECAALKTKQELLKSDFIKDNAIAQNMLIKQWWTECKPHIKAIDAEDSKVFRDLRKSQFVGDIELHKKWKHLSIPKRENLWKYVKNMTQMAQIQEGDAPMFDKDAQANAAEFAEKLGLNYNEKTMKAEFDPTALKDMVLGMATDPTGKEFQGMVNLGNTMGSAMGMDVSSMQTLLAQHMASEAAPSTTTKKKKKKADSKPPAGSSTRKS
jgi:hypothetical protein